MGDDEAGASVCQFIQGAMDGKLGAGIHGAGGFVQNQDGPGDGEQLALASGKALIPFGKDGSGHHAKGRGEDHMQVAGHDPLVDDPLGEARNGQIGRATIRKSVSSAVRSRSNSRPFR